jgi:aerobic-type carbon monoxide dehydrogenase small subunit (CoxS/CutS family)
MPSAVSLTLNGKPVRLETDGKRTLLWVLRTDLGLTGTKYGCGVGLCGSCTVVVDGRAVRSCRTSLADVQGRQVTTIEGLATGDRLHPLQEAFVARVAFQCGYCTPGMILGAYALLRKNPKATRADAARALEGHVCRCGAHARILEAVESAAAATKGGSR